MTVVRFTPLPDERIRLDYPFSREINEIVKSMPVRGFDSSSKSWWVHERYGEELANHILAAGHDVTGGEGSWAARAEPSAMPTIDEVFDAAVEKYDAKAKARVILDDIPVQHQGKVFRAMSRLLYPDLYAR